MSGQLKLPTSPDEFLRWNEGRDGKREFAKGRVVEMMVGVSKHHFIIVSRLLFQLMRQLGLKDYAIGSAEFGVKTQNGARYPDVLVDRIFGARGELSAREPLLIAEVLSPSSYVRDFGEKVVEYTLIPSLLHYLVLSQDEPRAWLWSRVDEVAWQGPVLSSEIDEMLSLSNLNVEIDLAEVYSGLDEQGSV